MDAERLLTAVIGAFFGAAGWLCVGLYMQRRQYERQARNAARAVYFELTVNHIEVEVALRHGAFGTLSRTSFERLLPELATWLRADELEIIARAYMSLAGYEQLHRDATIPAQVRTALLQRILDEQTAAVALLRSRAFSGRDAARLTARAPAPQPGSMPTTSGRAPGG
jgi:hypothetical protein